MNGFSKGILLLNTGSGPAFFIEQAFKLNMDWISMRIGALIGVPCSGLFAGEPAKRPEQSAEMPDQFLSWQSSCRLAWVMLLSAGTLRVSHTLPPMVEPLPMVMRPSTVAPA